MEKQAQNQATTHFDLLTRGLGYLNRVREVDVRNGNRKAKFLACAIRGMSGSSDAPNWTPFDVKVVGDDCIEVIKSLQPHLEAKRKVLVSFVIGDIYPHVYPRKLRDRDGRETGQGMKILWIYGRIDATRTLVETGETRPISAEHG